MAPIPEAFRAEAARVWWHAFGLYGLRWRVPQIRAGQGAMVVDDAGRVRGVIGLRDGSGGFLVRLPLLARWFYRAAPATGDLVIDGIVTLDRREGLGRRLVRAAADRARAGGHPGLRAEVRLGDAAAVHFWRRMGFLEIGRGRYGWPWSGTVMVMRRDLEGL